MYSLVLNRGGMRLGMGAGDCSGKKCVHKGFRYGDQSLHLKRQINHQKYSNLLWYDLVYYGSMHIKLNPGLPPVWVILCVLPPPLRLPA